MNRILVSLLIRTNPSFHTEGSADFLKKSEKKKSTYPNMQVYKKKAVIYVYAWVGVYVSNDV